jgi:hypothetical protein
MEPITDRAATFPPPLGEPRQPLQERFLSLWTSKNNRYSFCVSIGAVDRVVPLRMECVAADVECLHCSKTSRSQPHRNLLAMLPNTTSCDKGLTSTMLRRPPDRWVDSHPCKRTPLQGICLFHELSAIL